MNLWWIANAALVGVVVPAMVVLLARLLGHVRRLNRLAETVLEHGTALSGELEDFPKLLETQQLTAAARGLVDRYCVGVLRMVRAGE